MILDCYKILKRIEFRPQLWTGQLNLKSLDIFIRGYNQALIDIKHIDLAEPTDPFFDWIANQLGYYESTAGWANMILAFTLGFDPKNINWELFLEKEINQQQHRDSIILFYKLLDEFKNEHR